MTWSAVGTWHGTNTAALSLSNQATGNLLIAEVANFSNSTVWCTGLTGGGATWVQAGVKFSGTTNAFSAAVFLGTVTATGAQTATPTWSGTAPASYRTAAQEFHSTAGAWAFKTQGNLDGTGTSNWPSLNAAAGDLYFGYSAALVTPSAGSTSGYVYNVNVDTDNDTAAYNLNCPSGATFPVWGDTGEAFGIMILVAEKSFVSSALALAPVPPGWFPGAQAVTVDPGGIPFYAEPQPTDAAPAVIIPPAPEAAPAVRLAPGWFPGSAAVTQDPGGIPFYSEPQPTDAAPAVIFPIPEAAGFPEWLPLPPNWFPGSNSVTTDPGSIPFYSLPQPQTPPPAPPPLPYVAGLGGSGYNSWFTDQNGNPRLMVVEQAWALPFNAGRWNSGNYQADFNTYFSARSAQGYTAWYGVAWGSTHVEPTSLPARSWDGVYALKIDGTPGRIATGAETVTLNAPFWDRIDAMFATARRFGISCFLNMGLTYDIADVGAMWANATNTQGTAFGAALAARFPQASYPHVFWFFGDDDGGSNDPFWQAILTGMQSAGDTRALISNEQDTNTNSHVEYDTGAAFGAGFGASNATYNWVYSYDAPYFGVERSYTEGGSFARIPPLYGDGIYYGDSGGGPTFELAIRTFAWWALASGSRGFASTSGPSFGDADALWMWHSTAAIARLATDPNGTWTTSKVGQVAAFFSGLTDWHKLIPDTSNSFIISGRGTRGTCDPPNSGFNVRVGSTYVAGSITPNGTLAIAYCRASMSITIDQTRLGAGFTATWVDPSSLATQSAGTGSAYSSSGLGNNSAGAPDWVLVFQGPAVPAVSAPPAPVIPLAPGWFPGADRVTAEPGGVPFYVVPQPTDQVAAPAAGATTTATAALAGAGAVAALVTEAPIATAAGAGAVAAVVTEAATASASGAGAVTAVVTEIAGASLAAAGAVTDVATQAVTASLAGAGSVTDVVTQAVIASLTGAGALTANVAGAGSTANLAGAGAVTALATVAATATAAGAGAVTATVTQAASAALSGAGALTAAGQITGTANLTGAGALSAKATQAVTAQAAGSGALTALAAQGATAALAGAGAVTAVSGTAAAFTVGQLSAATAAGSTLTAATAPGGAAGGILTASDQRTGGPG